MAEDKKGFMSQITPGNLITIGIVVVGAITAWAKIQVHLQDDALHVNEGEVVLTKEEYNNLLRMATIVQSESPIIKENENRITELEKGDAVHFSEYQTLFQEHDDLEGKVSRIYKELKDDIRLLDD